MSEPATPRSHGPSEFEAGLSKASDTIASFDEGQRNPLVRLQNLLHSYPTLIPIIVLALSFAVFSIIVGPRFYSMFNMGLIIQQVSVIAIVGMAQTLVIMTAGIDLSVGAIMIFSHILMGKMAVDYGLPVPVAFVGGLLCGLLCGLMNGALVTWLRLPPFIATLGSFNIFMALYLWYSAASTISNTSLTTTAPFLLSMGTPISVGGQNILTYGTVLMAIVALVVWYLISRTAFGRHVLAVGDDPEAARLAGIRTTKTLLGVYALAGLICGIAGWAMIGRVGAVSPNSGLTMNLDSITAVVIGGTSLFGGRGSVIGTIVGAVIVGLFASGLKLAGADTLWQVFAIGWLIIIAVAIDQWIRKVSA